MSSVAPVLGELRPTAEHASVVTRLYESHREGIYRFLLRQGMHPEEAQEATQDAFVDLQRAVRKGIDIASPQAWLYRVASRAALDYWRRQYKQDKFSVPLEEEETTSLRSTEPSPEETAQGRQRLERMAAGMDKLPKEQLLCIQLRMRGFRYREIASAAGVPISTVADRLTAALVFLRQECQ